MSSKKVNDLLKKHGKHHVSRIDIDPTDKYPNRRTTHGWQIRLMRRTERVSKFFSDKKSGSSAAALEAAIAFRDAKMEEMPPPISPSERLMKPRTKTGVLGISMKRDNYTIYVEAYGMVDGKSHSTRYSVNKWGLRRAIWKACVYRANLIGDQDAATTQANFDKVYAYAEKLIQKKHTDVLNPEALDEPTPYKPRGGKRKKRRGRKKK